MREIVNITIGDYTVPVVCYKFKPQPPGRYVARDPVVPPESWPITPDELRRRAEARLEKSVGSPKPVCREDAAWALTVNDMVDDRGQLTYYWRTAPGDPYGQQDPEDTEEDLKSII